MAVSALLTGGSRVEYSIKLGRGIRHGALSELGESDHHLFARWLNEGRFQEAEQLLGVLGPLYLDMCSILLQWSLQIADTLRQRVGTAREADISSEAFMLWQDIAAGERERNGQRQAQKLLASVLAPDSTKSDADPKAVCQGVNAQGARLRDKVYRRIQDQDGKRALSDFNAFAERCLSVHDLLCHYLWVYPSVLAKHCGQAVSEAVLYESFESCSNYQMLMRLILEMDAEELSAFLAEHLRGHFSGPDRQGEVAMYEEEECFRLIFDACGSGGAMRRKAAARPMPGLDVYQQATPSTWNRAGDVPSYCAHCAQNEMALIRHLGYPAWVVEFDPDPMKPCEWRIYKSASQIPKRYFTRLGLRKP